MVGVDGSEHFVGEPVPAPRHRKPAVPVAGAGLRLLSLGDTDLAQERSDEVIGRWPGLLRFTCNDDTNCATYLQSLCANAKAERQSQGLTERHLALRFRTKILAPADVRSRPLPKGGPAFA